MEAKKETYNESQIIEQLRRPETQRKAFTLLVDRYSQTLYWQIRRIVLTHEDTDDLLQNTFIKAWNNLHQYRGEAKISTWLYRIAMNETLNFVQRKKIHCSIEENATNISEQLAADSYFDGDETAIQLQQAISQLPEKQRTVFCLKYYDEMKYEEMSQVLDTSIGALKASYHHAVKKITDFFNSRD